MYEDAPAYAGLESVLGGAETVDILKQAGLVAGGAILGKYINSSTASMLTNAKIRSGVEAALGVFGAVFGVNKGNEWLEWLGIGIAAAGIGDLIGSFMPNLPTA